MLKPTRGTIAGQGKVSPILELGVGLDFELTGMENIYLMALFRGFAPRRDRAKAESIAEFSGLGEFIDSPVRNYSTGMIARLSFAIATAWKPDVLVLGEVLTVGDAASSTAATSGSRNSAKPAPPSSWCRTGPLEILHQCTRCIWIDGGLLMADGTPIEVVSRYAESPATTKPWPSSASAPDSVAQAWARRRSSWAPPGTRSVQQRLEDAGVTSAKRTSTGVPVMVGDEERSRIGRHQQVPLLHLDLQDHHVAVLAQAPGVAEHLEPGGSWWPPRLPR